MLLVRKYRPGVIHNAIDKARLIPRAEALKRVVRKKTSKRPVFAIMMTLDYHQ